MARTRRTARMSTGGGPPRNQKIAAMKRREFNSNANTKQRYNHYFFIDRKKFEIIY